MMNSNGLLHTLTPPSSEPMTSPSTSLSDNGNDFPEKPNNLSPGSSKHEAEPGDQTLNISNFIPDGNVEIYKCTKCKFVTIAISDFWAHGEIHMTTKKSFNCPKCSFVTRHKHHLMYHIRKHEDIKPFKCTRCEYTCTNKSMLNSHLKVHSNFYPYRCRDCTYKVKFLHPLKMHLRKYGHQPALVLNADGTPSPRQVTNIHGKRRGFKAFSEDHVTDKDTPLSVTTIYVSCNEVPPMSLCPSSEFKVDEYGALDLSKQVETECEVPTVVLDQETTNVLYNVEAVLGVDAPDVANDKSRCGYCFTDLKDPILVVTHKCCRSFEHPSMCVMCGEECKFSVFQHACAQS